MTRHNACTNPACKNNVTGWTGNGSAPTQATLSGFPDRTTGASYTSGTFIAGPVIAVTAGDTWTISIYARSNAFNTNSGNIYLQWSGGGSTSAGYTLTAGVAKRISVTGTVPGGNTTMQIIVDGQNFASSSYDVTECLYEKVGSLDTYFDGDTTPGGSWDGTDGNSASTLTSGVSGDVSTTLTATITATGVNTAVGGASETVTATLTAAGVNAAVGAVSKTTTATLTASGTNAAVGGTATTVTAGITATGTNAAVGAATATTTTATITTAATVGSVASVSTTATITAAATVTHGAGAPRTGVTGWDLYSTLAQQAAYVDYYRTVPPVACPNDGEPLKSGPPAKTGVLYCPWGDFQYPRDWDPNVHGGM